MLRYETELNVDNRKELQIEAEQVWKAFRESVEREGFKQAILSAVESEKTPFISVGRGFNFILKKLDDGQWAMTTQ